MDMLVRELADALGLGAALDVLRVIATDCNGGVKEVLGFETLPDRWALWHRRCPQVNDLAPACGASRKA